MKLVGKFIKYIAITITTIVVLVFALLSNASFQSYLAAKVATYLSETSGMSVEIGKINIGRLLTIDIDELVIKDKHDTPMFDIGKLSIAGITYKPIGGMISIGKVGVYNADVNLVQYLDEKELNINLFINAFSTGDTTQSSGTMPKIEIKRVDVERTSFRYQNENAPPGGRAMDYTNIRTRDVFVNLRNVIIDGLKFDFQMDNLSAVERSGLIVKSMSGDFKLSSKYLRVTDFQLITPYSNLDCDFGFYYTRWRDYVKFITNMNISADIRHSHINTLDIGRFAEALYGFNNEIELKCTGDGYINNLCLDVDMLKYGKNTKFTGSINIKGLPNIDKSVFNLSMHKFNLNIADIFNISIGSGRKLDYIFKPPQALSTLGDVTLRGKFDGTINDFQTSLNLENSEGGIVDIDCKMNLNDAGERQYEAKVSASDTRIGRIAGIKELGSTSFNISVKGTGFDYNSMKLKADADITRLSLLGYEYHNLSVSGIYIDKRCDADIVVDDSNLKMNLNGFIDFDDDNTLTEFDLKLKKAVLNKLHFIKPPNDTTDIAISTGMRVKFAGVDIDKNIAFINLDSTLYSEGNKSIFMKQFDLTTQMSDNQSKSLHIKSDYLNGELIGQINFRQLKTAVSNILDNSLFNLISNDSITINQSTEIQNFNFSLNITNIQPVLNFFMPDIKITQPINFEGGMRNSDESIFIQGSIPKVNYAGIGVINTHFLLSTRPNNSLEVKLRSDSINIGGNNKDVVKLLNWNLGTVVHNDTVDYKINWLGNDTVNHISGGVMFKKNKDIDLKIENSYISGIEGGTWRFNPKSLISFKNNDIGISDLEVSNGTELIGVYGHLGHADTSSVKFVLDNFKVSNFDIFLKDFGGSFVGDISGYFEIINPYNVPKFQSSIKINNCAFEDEPLGDISVMVDYDRDNEIIEVAVRSIINNGSYKYSPISVNGFYYPTNTIDKKGKKAGTFDLNCKVQNFNIATSELFLNTILSDIKGHATGYFQLKGTIDEPDINGSIKLQNAQFRVKYLNTLYYLSDEFHVDNHGLTFNDVKITDTLGRVAVLNGDITHKNLKDFYLNLRLTPTNFAVLYTNRMASSVFYGSASASGDIEVKGPVDDIVVSAKVSTTKGSDIYIPISSTSTIEDSYFIVFVDSKEGNATQSSSMVERTTPKNSGFSLNFDIGLNPDTQVSVLIPGSMGNLTVAGNGNVALELSKYGNFSLNGDYVVSSGTFVLNLENIYGKQLDIKRGSKIAFKGDPADARIDIATYYKTRTTLAGLNLADETYSTTRTDVNAMIYLKNNLTSPEMWFSVEFPGMDPDIKQLVYSSLDTNNQALMTQQVLSLLLLNSFSMTSSSGLVSNLAGSSIELVTNQLNKLLSSFSKNVDIGFNYRPGDNTVASEYEVALATNFFDNRLQVSGNFGVRQDNVTAENASQIIGDVLISYKLTKEGNVRIVGYNETNNVTLGTSNAPYTQGIGISLSKSFNNIKELFEKKKKTDKKNKIKRINKEAKKEDEVSY